MANKFLPFVVPTSTPMHIYQTLLSRSKGMNLLTVTSVFMLVLKQGIKECREFAKNAPEVSVENLYEQMIGHFPDSRIPEADLQLFVAFKNHFPEEASELWDKDLNDFSKTDIMAFFYVLAVTDNLESVTKIKFGKVLTHQATVLADIKSYVKFSDTGAKKDFDGLIDLKAYILYRALLISMDHDDNDSKELPAICASFYPGGKK